MAAKWSNDKAARIGFLLGQGFTAPAVARLLNDGTTPETIGYMRRVWGLVDNTSGCNFVELRIPLNAERRADLSDQANALMISPTEFVRRVLVCVLDDDLYSAVNDGRFK
jgi:hypothetical protein